MEWSELKELLKECDLKAGQIFEIKNYLALGKGKIEVLKKLQAGTSYTVKS